MSCPPITFFFIFFINHQYRLGTFRVFFVRPFPVIVIFTLKDCGSQI